MFHLHAGKNCVIHLNNINQLIEQKCYFGLDIPINSCCSSCAVKYVVENLNQLIDAANTNNIHSMIVLGYYYMLETDYNNAIKYYKMVLSNDHSKLLNDDYNMLLNNLGDIYCRELNEDEMKKYYLMAIDNGSIIAMYNLGYHYFVHAQYDEMKKYYEMAIQHNDTKTFYYFGKYYELIEKNYDKMKECYENAIKSNHITSIYRLGQYYELTEHDNILAQKYYLMLIDNGCHFELINKFEIIRLYFLTKNKEFVMTSISDDKIQQINNFLNNAIQEICQSCFLENLCCTKNNVYLCGLCY